MLRALAPVAFVVLASSWPSAARAQAPAQALRLPDGTRVGTLAGPAPSSWERLDPGPDRWRTGWWGARHQGALELVAGASVPALPTPTRRSRVASQVDLETDGGTVFTTLYCIELDILQRVRPDGRVALRVHPLPGLALEGLVRQEPRAVGWGNCAARVQRGAGAPAWYRPVDPGATARVRLRGAVWWDEGRGCRRWVFRRSATGLRLERRERRPEMGGVVEDLVSYPFDGTVGSLEMYAASVTTRWVRRPRRLAGVLGQAGSVGLVMSLAFVEAGRDVVRWVVGGRGATAYHPDDAQAWYRTRAACAARR